MLYHFLSAKSDHSVFFLLLGTNLAWKRIYFFYGYCVFDPVLCSLGSVSSEDEV